MSEAVEIPYRVEYDLEVRHLAELRAAERGVDWAVREVDQALLDWLRTQRNKPDLADALQKAGCRLFALGVSKLGTYTVLAFLGMADGLRKQVGDQKVQVLPTPAKYGAEVMVFASCAAHACQYDDLPASWTRPKAA